MKLDMGAAWNDAVAMISGNREVLVIVAGVFFFLPSLAAVFLVPVMDPPPPGADLEVLKQFLLDFYARNAVPFILLTLAQAVGFLALLSLLRDDSKPTVGDAIKSALIGMITYIGAQLIFVLAAGLVVGVLIGLPMAVDLQALAFFTMLLAIVALIYVTIKLTLVMPIIAIDRDLNPISVLRRSWALTKGNSLRLFAFYFLLGIGFVAISVVIGLVFGLAFSLLGEGTMFDIANGTVSGLLSAAGSLVFAAVLAAIHRQLGGSSGGRQAGSVE